MPGHTADKLIEALERIPVIDAHEHLVPEKERTSMTVDFSVLFSQYTTIGLVSAGMPQESLDRLYGQTSEQRISVEEKWGLFREYYPYIKHMSLLQPARIWIRDVLGFDDINDDSFMDISRRLQENNKPGIYRKILKDMCSIEFALACRDEPEAYDEDDRSMIMPLLVISSFFPSKDGFMQKYFSSIGPDAVPDVGEYLEWIFEEKKAAVEQGIYGVKSRCFPGYDPDRKKAQEIIEALYSGKLEPGTVTNPISATAPLVSVINDRGVEFARDRGLTVAVHSGVWGDFRDLAPGHLIPVAVKYPDVKFNLFHLGMPYVREAVMIAMIFPNVSLNLTWAHAVSQQTTIRTLDECMDMVPLNKIIGFGGDYISQIEKVYGALKMTQENIARVLAKRIDKGDIDVDEALQIARMWLYDNAKEIYGLS